MLVIDEVGHLPLNRAEADMFFQPASRRYEKGSTILTSNNTFAEWGTVIAINGLSYRLEDPTDPVNTADEPVPQDPAGHRHVSLDP